MRLIDAVRFSQVINESNIGDLIAELQRKEKQGQDISDNKAKRIRQWIDAEDVDITSVMAGLEQVGITAKHNKRIYQYLYELLDNNPSYATSLGNFLSNRETKGIEIPKNKIFNLKEKCNKACDNADLITKLANTTITDGPNRGPFEYVVAIFTKNGNVDGIVNRGDDDKSHGDVALGNEAVEIKASSGAILGSTANGGRLPSPVIINHIKDCLNEYYNAIQSQNLIENFDANNYVDKFEVGTNGIQFNMVYASGKKGKPQFNIDRYILAPATNNKVINESELVKLIIETYKNIFTGFFTNPATQITTSMVNDTITQMTSGRNLKQMISSESVTTDRVKFANVIVCIFLILYQHTANFDNLLIISSKGDKAIMITADELKKNPIMLEKDLANNGIIFTAPGLTPEARQSAVPKIGLK